MEFLLIRAGKNTVEEYFLHSEALYPPLGLEYIGASLEHDGHKVKIIDYCIENFSKEDIAKYLKSADAVGMSTNTYNLEYAINIANTIKEIDSEIPLIVDGSHCTHNQNSLNDIHNADIYVIGHGEKVIVDIARFLEGKNLCLISLAYIIKKIIK